MATKPTILEPTKDVFTLIVSTSQMDRFIRALKALDEVCPLTDEEKDDIDLQYLTETMVSVRAEGPSRDVDYGVCL